MLKLSNVSIAYNEKVVLNQLDLTASRGEIIGVAAPNGTGIQKEVQLPPNHLYISKHLLCIPMEGLSIAEQTKWIERLLRYNEKELTVGLLGTVEYYDKYYAEMV